MRTVEQLGIKGVVLSGTCHWPVSTLLPSASPSGQPKIGILMTNAGWLPRSSRGDLAVQLADQTASCGFPTFRFDLPGLGDSDGELPDEVLPFFQLVQDGGHTKFLAALSAELRQRHNLSSLICLGHCGSATTAVYAAAQGSLPGLAGLILLDPSFVLYRAPGDLSRNLLLGRAGLHLWLAQKRHGEKVIQLYSRAKTWYRNLRRNPTPEDTNQRLLGCYRTLLTKKLLILVLTAPPARKAANYFDYAKHIQGTQRSSEFTHVEVNGTDHAFLGGDGKQVVINEIRNWLRQHFASTFVTAEPAEGAMTGHSGVAAGEFRPR